MALAGSCGAVGGILREPARWGFYGMRCQPRFYEFSDNDLSSSPPMPVRVLTVQGVAGAKAIS